MRTERVKCGPTSRKIYDDDDDDDDDDNKSHLQSEYEIVKEICITVPWMLGR